MRTRSLTTTLSRPEVSVLVEEFRCQSHSLANQVGASASHRLWRLGALGHGRDATEVEFEPLGEGEFSQGELSEGVGSLLPSSVGRDLSGVTLEVITDSGVGGLKAAVSGTQVAIREDEAQIYPAQPLLRGKLHDDWMREWKYCGRYPMVGFVRPGEAWIPGTVPTDVPSQVGDAANIVQTFMLGNGNLKTMHEILVGANRYPAVLTSQLPGGNFEVTAFKLNDRGVAKYTPVEFPAIHKSKIFLTSTGENIAVPECISSLEVCRANPQGACVFVSGESFLEHLGRPSPRGLARRIVVDCPKPHRPDVAKQMLREGMLGIAHSESPVKLNAHSLDLEHFLSGEVRRGSTIASRLHRSWTLQLGPFATHTLRLEKKSHVSSVMTLYVDDEVLAECTSSDLGGSPDVWHCKFCFLGERQMDFKVFDETKDGWPLDTRSDISRCYQYRHVVEVKYQHRAIDNLTDASITIDRVPFERIPCMLEEHEGLPDLSITPSVLKAQFGIEIPKKVAPQDTRWVASQLGSSAVQQAGGWVAIGEAASKTIEDVHANARQLGSSAVEQAGGWAAISGAASKTIEDVHANLSKLGSSAWETVFSPPISSI